MKPAGTSAMISSSAHTQTAKTSNFESFAYCPNVVRFYHMLDIITNKPTIYSNRDKYVRTLVDIVIDAAVDEFQQQMCFLEFILSVISCQRKNN